MTAAGSDETSTEAAELDCVQALREAWVGGRKIARVFEAQRVERCEPVPEVATLTQMELEVCGPRIVKGKKGKGKY
jgi:hypothetical protein